MLEKDVVKLLNQQVQRELYSAYMYLDISFYFTNRNLNGFANWFSIQYQEEWQHAQKFITYLQDNDEEVALETIEKPHFDNKDTLAVLEAVLKHEQFITASINDIYTEADNKKDRRTMSFLNWFVDEQMEEEKNAADLITDYKLYKEVALPILDQKLAARTLPAQV